VIRCSNCLEIGHNV